MAAKGIRTFACAIFLFLATTAATADEYLSIYVEQETPTQRSHFYVVFDAGGGNLPTFGAEETSWETEFLFFVNAGLFGGEFPNLTLNPFNPLNVGGTPLGEGSQGHGLGGGFFPGNSPHLVLGGGEEPVELEPIDPDLQQLIEFGLAMAPLPGELTEGGFAPGTGVTVSAFELIAYIESKQFIFGTEFSMEDIAAVLFPGGYVDFNANGELSENIFAFDPTIPQIGGFGLNLGPNGAVGIVFIPPVPEPATLALLVAGLAFIGWRRRRALQVTA